MFSLPGMNLFRKLRLAPRLAILLLVLSAGLLGYGVWSYRIVDIVRVGGPVYKEIIDSQDLVSDVLPPPLYIIESYLLCLQITAATNGNNQGALIDRLRARQLEYEKRYAYWTAKPLSREIATRLQRSHVYASEFYRAAQQEFLPALFLNDRAKMAKALQGMTAIYDLHRVEIDQIVKLAESEAELKEHATNATVDRAKLMLVAVLVMVLVAGIVIAGVIHASVVHPIEKSLAIARRVAAGDYTVEAEEKVFRDEAGRLLEALGKMAASLQMGKETIAARDASLREALDHIVESEKIAAMGGIVAGVAHELNTPLGTAITTVSSQSELIGRLQAAVQTGSLRKSDLLSNLALFQEMAELLERNVRRAADMVDLFKQVMTDQSSEQKQAIYLGAAVDDALLSLRHTLRKGDWDIHNRIPSNLLCNSLPGPLGQVLHIVLHNAVEHGYRGLDSGTIDIEAVRAGDFVELSVRDYGCGMDPSTQQRVFEPFFTTTFGRGRSGLSLAIAYRICSTVLAGGIQVKPGSDPGSTFVIRLPAIALPQ